MSSAGNVRAGGDQLARVAELRQTGVEGVPALISEFARAPWNVRRAIVVALAEADRDAMPILCTTLRVMRDDEARIAGLVDALSVTRNDVDDLVLELARSSNPAVLCDAAQVLGRRESARAVTTLRALTEHGDDNVALAAAEALGRIGGREALDSLLQLAASRNFFRTFPTIEIIGRSKDARALPTLLELARDPLYGREAVRALGRLGAASAVPVLLEIMSRASADLVCATALTLVAIRDAVEQRFATGRVIEQLMLGAANLPVLRRQSLLALNHADTSEQLALSQVLSWVGEASSVPALLALLLRGTPEVARVAAASLRKLGAVAEPSLVSALRSGTSEERRLLVPVLVGKLSARDALVDCLNDDDATVRASSCDALAKTSDPTAVPALFGLLTDPDPRVGQAALAAIQSLGSHRTRELALTSAKSGDARLRRAGLRIIGYFGYPEGLPVLTEASRAEDEKIREAAISGLPLIESTQALNVLLEAARHPSSRTRSAAMRALGHTTGEVAARTALRGALGDPDPWVRYYACQALGRLKDEPAIEAIAQLLEDESGQVRVSAIEALAHLPGSRSLEFLLRARSAGDPDMSRAALIALGLSKRNEALQPLLAALASVDAATRLVALSALAELGAGGAVPATAAATRDPDEGVRVAATGFLAARSDPETTSELLRLLSETPEQESLIDALARPAAGRAGAIKVALAGADEPFAEALIATLARTRSEEATGVIRSALASHNTAARRAAASALVAVNSPDSAASLTRAALSDPDPEVRRICSAFLVR